MRQRQPKIWVCRLESWKKNLPHFALQDGGRSRGKERERGKVRGSKCQWGVKGNTHNERQRGECVLHATRLCSISFCCCYHTLLPSYILYKKVPRKILNKFPHTYSLCLIFTKVYAPLIYGTYIFWLYNNVHSTPSASSYFLYLSMLLSVMFGYKHKPEWDSLRLMQLSV